MNAFSLCFSWLRQRPWHTALNIVLVALGMASVTALLLFDRQFRERLTADARNIDLVVGAKGSPLQLLLSTVYHVDVPTGNIPIGYLSKLRDHPLVETAVPLTIGDSYRGARLVGTEHAYLDFFGAGLLDGNLWNEPFEAVLGARAAQQSGLRVGDRFEGNHGLNEGDDTHEGNVFKVVGRLSPTDTVLDRLILISPESTWLSHGQTGDRREMTAVLIHYATPMAAVRLPGDINRNTEMTAASPALQAARLLAITGSGIKALRGFGFLLVIVAGLSIFITLNQAMRERRADLAVFRVLGASPQKIGALMIIEALFLTGSGTVAGIATGHVAIEVLGRWFQSAREMGLTGLAVDPREGLLLLIALSVALSASILPAFSASRMDIPTILSGRV